MAGSYNHVVKKSGALNKPDRVLGMLDCYHGDVYEAIEEMYGMIWYLATEYSAEIIHSSGEVEENSPEAMVEEARQNYKQGLEMSPTKRKKN